MDIIFLVAGLAILFVGGELTVRGAVGLARFLGVSPAVIGLTVVGFGTSAPELVVTVQAALAGKSGLAIGNVVGSNISNLLLILGVGAVMWPLTCGLAAAKRDAGMMVFSAVILVALGMYGQIEWWHGIIMVGLLLIYLGATYFNDKKDQASRKLHEREVEELEELESAPTSVPLIFLFTALGLVGLVVGADLMVKGAIGIAESFGVPETVIGLTIVALGTSLPELAATAVAAYRKHTDVAIANVLGSCVFNVLSILGITSMVSTLVVEPDIRNIDLWVMLAATLFVTVMLLKNCKIGRATGAVLILAYVAYIASLAPRVM
ncbi:MAG: sodium:calcium antiporter [Rhodospirillaceae bacterium]|jgi:cation:H+ antiporter|uniref:calcium/sodium antiporter n=1 Tax=unclassified Hwanghaeella TaxID=2605944 RepID=UPI000C440F41|nr:sodium:calcium antiporter [Rhodospirillales bacterium]MAX47788.1 sodium:calcium antiporter [Rhodospirillaceae bacterium]|tara:strand:+ start:1359 stop:2321 length:963 start_codon:yes stop_codon:yes gene_type:complete